MSTKNHEMAKHLKLISQLVDLDGGNRFQIKAFSDAASFLETLEAPVEKLYEEQALGDLKGIGASIQEVISDYLETGTSLRLTELGKKFPLEAMTMTAVTGIGARTAIKFYNSGIKNLDELVLEAQTPGKLKDKMREAVLAADRFVKGRIPHFAALNQAKFIVDELSPFCSKIEICGSLRRKTIDSKDIDIVAIPGNNFSRNDVYSELGKLGEVINVGESKSSIRFEKFGPSLALQVDLWLVTPVNFGSALVYCTGSRDHCVALRTLAKSRGMTINEYGIFSGSYPDGKRLGGELESDIYDTLGLKTPKPEERTGDLS